MAYGRLSESQIRPNERSGVISSVNSDSSLPVVTLHLTGYNFRINLNLLCKDVTSHGTGHIVTLCYQFSLRIFQFFLGPTSLNKNKLSWWFIWYISNLNRFHDLSIYISGRLENRTVEVGEAAMRIVQSWQELSQGIGTIIDVMEGFDSSAKKVWS